MNRDEINLLFKGNEILDYQGEDIAWKYDYYVKSTKENIEMVKQQLKFWEERLKYLEDHPPLYNLFNWSA